MSEHINAEGRFQSDKYPTCPAGKVPLSTRDVTAQDLLWEYAQRRRAVDPEFSEDLETCLRNDGYEPKATKGAGMSWTAKLTLVELRALRGGRCPDCGGLLYQGPRGGFSRDVMCPQGSEFIFSPIDAVCERLGPVHGASAERRAVYGLREVSAGEGRANG